MQNKRLNPSVKALVETGWASLIKGLKKERTDKTGIEHFTDIEKNDVGPLKDIDGINAFLEPYFLCPSEFVELPISLKKVDSLIDNMLTNIESDTGNNFETTIDFGLVKKKYFGFAPNPYSQFYGVKVDFIDAAASYIRVVCNLLKMHALSEQPIDQKFEMKLKNFLLYSCDFLIHSKIESKDGVRWMGTVPDFKKSSSKDFSNLFFTNCAALSLKKLIDNAITNTWLTPSRIKDINYILSKVPSWVEKQYKSGTGFFMDALKVTISPIGTVYALELLYSLDANMSTQRKSLCKEALIYAFGQISDIKQGSALQIDVFHSIPMPGGLIAAYDDRRYVGSVLSLIALAKEKDPGILTKNIINASEIIFNGVSSEWIDDSNLWDDGRPLICYTLDAIIGLIMYSLEVKSDSILIEEHGLKNAIQEVLQDDNIIELISSNVFSKIMSMAEKDIDNKVIESFNKISNKN